MHRLLDVGGERGLAILEKEGYGFIYITTNTINGKKYIGQRKYYGRWETYLGSGIALVNSIKKYGKENFQREIIAISDTKEELNELEKKYIEQVNATSNKNYYNIAVGGEGGNLLSGMSIYKKEIVYQKISKSLKGKASGSKNPMYGKHNSPWNKGKKGVYNLKTLSLMKRPKSNEHKQKLSRANLGKKPSVETLERLSASHKGKCGIRVICITTNEIFNTLREASTAYNININSLVRCCKGKQKTVGVHPNTGEKLYWEYEFRSNSI